VEFCPYLLTGFFIIADWATPMAKNSTENSTTTAKRKVGKPFQKGQSGNPNGRPKLPDWEFDLRAECRKAAPLAVQTLLDIMQFEQQPSVRVRAAELILDRGYGKATQTVEMNVKRDIKELSDNELYAIASSARIAFEAAESLEPADVYTVHEPVLSTGESSR
jgi:hypothetical protein